MVVFLLGPSRYLSTASHMLSSYTSENFPPKAFFSFKNYVSVLGCPLFFINLELACCLSPPEASLP